MEREVNLQGLLRETDVNKPTKCSKCGQPLTYKGLGEYMCEACGQHEYDDYGKIRVFLEEHPGSNVMQVEAGTGVSKNTINQLVAEGKFQIARGSGLRGDR